MHSQPGEPAEPVTATELADLQAGLLDDATAAQVRSRVRTDPEAAHTMAALDRVRRELGQLRDAPAPPAPAEVSASVAAALRGEHRVLPPDGAPRRHAARPPMRRAGAIIGVGAALAAAVIGVFALSGGDEPRRPAFRTDGPTAEHITVSGTGSAIPLPVAAIHALLIRPPDLRALADPRRCLSDIGYPAETAILGAQQVPDGVLLVLPGPAVEEVTVVVVTGGCPAGGSAITARTVLPRP